MRTRQCPRATAVFYGYGQSLKALAGNSSRLSPGLEPPPRAVCRCGAWWQSPKPTPRLPVRCSLRLRPPAEPEPTTGGLRRTTKLTHVSRAVVAPAVTLPRGQLLFRQGFEKAFVYGYLAFHRTELWFAPIFDCHQPGYRLAVAGDDDFLAGLDCASRRDRWVFASCTFTVSIASPSNTNLTKHMTSSQSCLESKG